jgi:N-acylneuraminate cytidylyltransferase
VSCVAVILARSGSKGVPDKNLSLVGGLSLLARSVSAARSATGIDRVAVSTDSQAYAKHARRYGAEVVMRPSSLATDEATSESALRHALGALLTETSGLPDYTMLIQCTSPFTTSGDLAGLLRTITDTGADSAFTAVPFHHFVWRVDPDGRAEPVNHGGKRRQRRQDRPPEIMEDGGAYVMRTSLFMETLERFCGETVAHVVSRDWNLEIDSPTDLARARALSPLLEPYDPDARLAAVRLVIFDFDGVMTDNAVYVSQDGDETVRCHRGDGFGIARLQQAGVRTLILSKERNPVVSRRAEKLGVEVIQGQDDKKTVLTEWLRRQNLPREDVLYVGNDVNDLECMRLVGWSACPADAHPDVLSLCSIILSRPGGEGAVRELCDMLLKAHRAT